MAVAATTRGTSWLGVGASLALHAALALWVWRLPPAIALLPPELTVDFTLEGAEPTVALLQLLGDVVDAALVDARLLVLSLQPTDETRHGLIDALDGDGGAAFGGFQPRRDRLDRGGYAM